MLMRLIAGFLALALTTGCAHGESRKVDEFHWQNVEHVIAISDIHGDYEQYIKVLEAAGNLCVRRAAPRGKLAPIDLFGLDGDYLGTLEGLAMPAAFPSEDRIAVIETDELDIERIVVYRVTRPE